MKRIVPSRRVWIVAGVVALLFSLPIFISSRHFQEKAYACYGEGRDFILKLQKLGDLAVINLSYSNRGENLGQECIKSRFLEGYKCVVNTQRHAQKVRDTNLANYLLIQEKEGGRKLSLYFATGVLSQTGSFDRSVLEEMCNSFGGKILGDVCIYRSIAECKEI